MNFSTHFRAAQGLAPVADALSGTVYSDIVRCDGGKVIPIATTVRSLGSMSIVGARPVVAGSALQTSS